MSAGPDLVVRGKINEPVMGSVVDYIAASPPDFRSSFSGSGLPFANSDQAFYKTPNVGQATLSGDNSFEVRIWTPSAYYMGLGSVYVPPTLYVSYTTTNGHRKVSQMIVGSGVPFRTLTYPTVSSSKRARKDCTFYYQPELESQVRSQEQILRSAGYPCVNDVPENFWGGKPAR